MQFFVTGSFFNGFRHRRGKFFEFQRLVFFFREDEVRHREGGDEGNGMG